MAASAAVASHQVRKPYTITKQRERWTEEEHSKFLEALKLYGRAWRRIEEYIGTKTAVQIRSHAQKFFSKLEREQACGIVSSIGHDIDVPPPRPKRKPSHPYPKKAGLSSSNSISDRDAEFLPLQLSPNCECSSKPESVTPPARSLSGLKLFGVVLEPPETASPPPATTEEESAVESGVTSRGANSNSSLRVHHSEVSSRDHETPGAGRDPQQLDVAMVTQAMEPLLAAAGMQIQDQVALSNLIALHYASFLASFHAASSGADHRPSPWQLLDPQKHQDGSTRADIIRWHSVTDSSSPCADKASSVTRVIGRKRPSPESAAEENKRRKEEDEKCCSSSVTASSVDKEGDEEAGSLATALRLDREDNDPRVGGFVRYKRPGQ